jgi:hypothetical protein
MKIPNRPTAPPTDTAASPATANPMEGVVAYEAYQSRLGPPLELGREFVDVPTNNQLTGQELLGYVLEGVMDPGNELDELRQFRGLRNDPAIKVDPSALRVLDVIDHWTSRLEIEGRTASTPEEKAQMTAQLTEAARPREAG